jgi:hypothetical protein
MEPNVFRIFSTAARVLLVFVSYALLLLVAASVVAFAGLVPAVTLPQPGSERVQGLPVVALASAGLLCWLVLRSRWSGAKLALGCGLAFFCTHTVLPELDALVVPGSQSSSAGGAAARWLGGGLFAATVAVAAVVILARTRPSELAPANRGQASILADTVKVAAAAALQLIVHAALGCRWGWYPAPQGLAFRGPLELLCPDFDAFGAASGGIELARASLWALIGLGLVRVLRRGPLETALAVGAFFALAAPVRQLLPSPLVPGEWVLGQRWALGASQLATGAALALWLRWPGPRFSRPRRAGGSAPHSLDTPSSRRGAAYSADSKGLDA